MTTTKQKNTGSPLILIVDDDADLRFLLCSKLTELGYECHDAADGDDALKTMDQHKFDVVLSDIAMPRMRGIELLAAARGKGFIKPFILISAYSDRMEVVRALRLGAFDFIEKPLDLPHLKTVIIEAVRVSQRLGAIEHLLASNPDNHDGTLTTLATMYALRPEKK